jgi:hypothetical protein
MICCFQAKDFFNASFLRTTAGSVLRHDIASMKMNLSQLEAALMVDRARISILIVTDQSVTGG